MIWFVYGAPRTGKSLFGGLVDNIIPAIAEGRAVYTNIPHLSIAGISSCADIPYLRVGRLIHPILNLQDVFRAFDDDSTRNCVFVLDEMRSLFTTSAELENWLSQRLNVAGKRGIDFVLIAQLPGYFSDETRQLGEGCSVFERGDRFLKRKTSVEFRFDRNRGTPYKLGKKWDTDNWLLRLRDPKYFRCYSSYTDAQFVPNEHHNKDTIFNDKRLKYFVIGFLAILASIGIAFWLLHSTNKFFHSFTSGSFSKRNVSQILSSSDSAAYKLRDKDRLIADSLKNVALDSVVYTSFIFDDGYVLKTDFGDFRNYEKVSRNCYLVDSSRTICYSSSQGVQGDR